MENGSLIDRDWEWIVIIASWQSGIAIDKNEYYNNTELEMELDLFISVLDDTAAGFYHSWGRLGYTVGWL